MIELVPNYYHEFKCIADKCRHTCCAGWEIDIDPETYALYQREKGSLSREIMSDIVLEYGVPSFKLQGKDERCPFLNDDNLCRLILAKGDESLLCNICRDHPRFINMHGNVTETGLGLACEEAARIVLGAKVPFTLIRNDDSGEEQEGSEEDVLYKNRDNDIRIMTDRSIPLTTRIEQVCGRSSLDSVQRARLFLSLEILDPSWRIMLEQLEQCEAHDVYIPNETCYENLIVYYMFRYPMFTGRYALENALLAHDLTSSLDEAYTLEDIVRRLSVEVEYSDLNPDTVAEAINAYRTC